MSVDFNRPIAKAIATGNIVSDLIYWLEKQRSGSTPTKSGIASWEAVRPLLAEIILPHLDAYDQKVS